MTRRQAALGFTILEVMISLAILASATALVASSMAQNARQARYARNVRVAAMLARQKMAAVETALYTNGFSDFAEEESGTFSEEGFPSFAWVVRAEKVELPANLAESAAEASKKLADATSALSNSQTGNTRALAEAMDSSMMSTLLASFGGIVEQVRSAMEDSIRRVTVRVTWHEPGRDEHLDVVAYFVDTTRMSLGTGGAVALPGGTGGIPGTGGGLPGGRPGSGGSSGSGRSQGGK